jgi:nucleotide-binding universal stress UspA family protein
VTVAISHILVPVDFSPHSVLSLEYAVALASRFGASLELLHVVEDPATAAWAAEGAVLDVAGIRAALVEDAERLLAEYRTRVEALDVPAITTVRIGSPAREIVDYAQMVGVDLIVMGTHGRSGFSHLFLGSVAERVVRHASCPVFTVRGADTGHDAAGAHVASARGRRGTSRE